MKVLTRQEEQILLAVYRLEDNAYLVTIREQLKQFTGKYFSVGTVYAPLERLHQAGYLDSFFGNPTAERGGKAIKYYRLSKKGFEALAEMKKMQEEMWDGFALPSYIK